MERVAAGSTVLERSVAVRAAADEVWRVLVDPEQQPRWLGGFRFATTWEVGGAFALGGVLNAAEYREPGTLLALEPPRLLRYDHWSALWGVPDGPGNRAVLTLTVAPTAEGCTVALHHVLPDVKALPQHAGFFWRGALHQLRRLAEGTD
ncbi:MAG: SRPBCC domain-containing protein [Myxococcota bacterium]